MHDMNYTIHTLRAFAHTLLHRAKQKQLNKKKWRARVVVVRVSNLSYSRYLVLLNIFVVCGVIALDKISSPFRMH